MNSAFRFLLLAVAVAAIAVLSCWISGRFFKQRMGARSVESHEWIHRELNISPAQDQVLTTVEDRYAKRRRDLMEAIRLANVELGQAVLGDREYSNRVTAAIEKIHHAQGELQKATLEHVFEMRTALTPEQYDKLLRSTAAALQSQPGQ